MNDDKKSSNSTNENAKVFNGEIFVNNNSNDLDFEINNNSLRKSTSNSNGGSLSNNIRGSFKSNQSNNERFLTKSLMMDLRGSSKKYSDKKIEFDKLKQKDQLNQINNSQLSNNSNSNNNEEDFLANIKLPKNEINTQSKQIDDDDLYEDVENIDNEENLYEMEEIENKHKNEETNDIININKLTKLNEFFKKNRKFMKKNNDSKGNELDDQSLRSSGGSGCISSRSNNSNGNISMNMNMRSSKIFNKKKKISPEKKLDNNSSGNIVHLDEGNLLSDNENNPISTDNNEKEDIYENKKETKEDIENKEDREINENKENNDKKDNKDVKDEKENKDEIEKKIRERKEKIAKIKEGNNELNFISKNAINSEKNKGLGEEYKIELEMQLFNFSSFESEKEKPIESNKDTINNIINKNLYTDFSNIIQKFEDSNQEEIPKINDNRNKEEKSEEKKPVKENEKDKIIDIPKETDKENIKEMEKEEYVFEKFGKLGWECEKCNNFNFESRTICNRCEAPKQPKSLEQIKIENEQKSGDKKKKPLIERKGDWQCPLCHNLNFAFRVSCNRCKLPKDMYLNFAMKQKNIENINNNMNNLNFKNNYIPQIPNTQIINNSSPQLIQNQFNFYHIGYVPVFNSYFPQNNFSQVPQQNINNINNMNNYKRKYKYYKQ